MSNQWMFLHDNIQFDTESVQGVLSLKSEKPDWNPVKGQSNSEWI